MFGKKYKQLEHTVNDLKQRIKNLEERKTSNDTEKLIGNQLENISEILSKGVENHGKKSSTTVVAVASLIVTIFSVTTAILLGISSSRREDELMRLQLDSQPLRYRIEWSRECQLTSYLGDCDIVLYVDAGRINNWIIIDEPSVFIGHDPIQRSTIGSGESITLNVFDWRLFFPIRTIQIYQEFYFNGNHRREGYNYTFIYLETSAGERILDMIYFSISELDGNFTRFGIQRANRIYLTTVVRPQYLFDYDEANLRPRLIMYMHYYNLITRLRDYGLLD